MRDIEVDALNASMNSIVEACLFLLENGNILLGKREGGGKRLPFDLQKQSDEGYLSNFFGRGSFELKLTHQGRKRLEEAETSGAEAEPPGASVPGLKPAEARNVSERSATPSSPHGIRRQPVRATILNVLVASPSDVSAERDAVESAIQEWNGNHHERMGIMLQPVRWETHSYPASGNRPQAILNKQIVESGDILIGIFGNKLGTPTGKAQSGTIEEIEEFRKVGKYVALYFSTGDVPRTVDREQLKALEDYQRERQKDTLYGTFQSTEELRRLVVQHLPKIVGEVSRSVGDLTPRTSSTQPQSTYAPRVAFSEPKANLSPKEIELLWNAAKAPDGEILHNITLDGESIRVNGKQFLAGVDARTGAEWIAAFRSVEKRGFIEPLSYGSDFFRVTGDGYQAADALEEFARWDAKSVVLRAHYLNAPIDEISLSCTRIIAIPARYFDDQIGADGAVQRSLKEPRSLLVEGITSKPAFTWSPTEIEFLDPASKQVQSFRVEGMQFLPPRSLKLPLAGEIVRTASESADDGRRELAQADLLPAAEELTEPGGARVRVEGRRLPNRWSQCLGQASRTMLADHRLTNTLHRPRTYIDYRGRPSGLSAS